MPELPIPVFSRQLWKWWWNNRMNLAYAEMAEIFCLQVPDLDFEPERRVHCIVPSGYLNVWRSMRKKLISSYFNRIYAEIQCCE